MMLANRRVVEVVDRVLANSVVAGLLTGVQCWFLPILLINN